MPQEALLLWALTAAVLAYGYFYVGCDHYICSAGKSNGVFKAGTFSVESSTNARYLGTFETVGACEEACITMKEKKGQACKAFTYFKADIKDSMKGQCYINGEADAWKPTYDPRAITGMSFVTSKPSYDLSQTAFVKSLKASFAALKEGIKAWPIVKSVGGVLPPELCEQKTLGMVGVVLVLWPLMVIAISEALESAGGEKDASKASSANGTANGTANGGKGTVAGLMKDAEKLKTEDRVPIISDINDVMQNLFNPPPQENLASMTPANN